MEYFPWIDSTCGVYADNDGVFRQVCNVNGNSTSDSSPYFISPMLPSPTSHVLLNTEVIKQTIFGHEAIFRNQVMELHRLYDKQREIMNEMRNDFNRENTQVRLASSDYGMMEQKQSCVSWLSPCYASQSVTHAKHFQREVGKILHTDKGTCQIERTSQQCELLDASKCKKYNNKVLDLQLLATEYMDDEEISLSASGVAEATHTIRSTFPSSATNREHIDHQLSGWDVQENGSRAGSASSRTILFDLNEPFNSEEAMPITSNEKFSSNDLSINTTPLVGCAAAGDSTKNVLESVGNVNDIRNHDKIVKMSCDLETVHKTNDSNICNRGTDHGMKRSSKKRTLNSRRAQGCLTFSENYTENTLSRIPRSVQLIHVKDQTETLPKHLLSPGQSRLDFRRNPIVVQALPCTHAPVLMRKNKSKPILTATGAELDKPRKKKGPMNPMVDHVNRSWKCKKGRQNLAARNVTQDSYRIEPLSPENEECSPPRRESDENLLDTRLHFYAAEDEDVETDVARTAAKAILLLSAADVRINNSFFFESSHVSPDNPLHLFAEIVLDESQKESMFHNIDDFETMTLRLEDTKTEEQYCRNIIPSQDVKLTIMTKVSGRATRARGQRSKKLKDFQGVVLPSISSLSKYEVTEDLQLIECLLEATETPKNCDSKKRNVCSRGRRQTSNSASTLENSPCSSFDILNKTSSEYNLNERRPMMIDWGKITRRRRGQRYPARKLALIQVAHTLKAH